MKILFAKSAWETHNAPLGQFVERTLADGYDAVELYLLGRPEKPAETVRLLHEASLPLIAQIATVGTMADEHTRSLESRYEYAISFNPSFINCHTGRDHFSFDDNFRIFQRAEELVARHGIAIRHETHRGRALFGLPASVQFLRAVPSLRLTADLSHWFCVHESDLSDQEQSLSEVLDRVDHLHARVGFTQGPQVSDPRNPAHAGPLARSMELWTRILQSANHRGLTEFTITPEFGPVPYMPYNGRLDEPLADAWEINRWMRDYLRENLKL
jgi:hypothetical protein